ncbi:hypothetical protein G6O69_34405 [Pseudenhygromyxa sp. WMMC2535]|uniref:Ig-like domain-containing protein n=1 Tax=Pseudenhygromyxa sp. WMMC2535 TaxID=2712867 RepID=UPI00155166E8|nr:Ig-like domain-containing protein [Pseudenhygromyxa sp. WMMC2535]NVB42965.1 hypothetical protein [Pseudenhygromyxa sp. WMMC2535]
MVALADARSRVPPGRHRLPSRRPIAPAAGLFCLSCAELAESPRFEADAAPLEIIETIPADGAVDVDPLTRIDICLSGELDPRVVNEFDATLHSATLTFDTQQEVQLFSWRAPGSRDLLASERWCPGSVLSLTPESPLRAGLTYRVRLRALSGLGWSGGALDTTQDGWTLSEGGDLRLFIEFRVAGSVGDPLPEEIPALPDGPSIEALFETGRVFDPERAACGCHQGGEGENAELALARLDLSDPTLAWSGLVLREGSEPTGFAMVSPRMPSESYLIQKMVRDAEGDALRGIHGVAMPPEDPLPHADLVDLAHWIAAGIEP